MLAVDPGFAMAHAGMGDALFRLERYEEAIESLARSVELHAIPPTATARLVLMGRAAQALGRSGAALGHYERAVEIDPRNPVLKDPDRDYAPGRSLCKLGFPFQPIVPVYDEEADTFTLPPGSVPLAPFPLEGMFTRIVATRAPGSGQGEASTFIETSSPTLIGQMGGPVFDAQARVWGIQSHTVHHPLGFHPPVPGGGQGQVGHQFLNTGLAVHASVIVRFLEAEGVAYGREAWAALHGADLSDGTIPALAGMTSLDSSRRGHPDSRARSCAGHPARGGPKARGPAAASVARSKVQDEVRELRANPGPTAWTGLRTDSARTADLGPSECEGMISSESPVLENSTPGLTSGGEGTWLRQRLRRRHRAKAAGTSYSLVPAAGRASPRLHKG